MKSADYMACDGPVFTIARMIRAKQKQKLPSAFQLGGRYISHPNQTSAELFAAHGRVRIPVVRGVPPYAWVILSVVGADIHWHFEEAGHSHCAEIRHIQNLTVAAPCHTPGRGEALALGRHWSAQTASQWSQFLFKVRSYFHEQDFLEVTTPTLVVNSGMEPELEPFATEWRQGRERRPLFLHTSPELHLKPLLTQGFSDVFEMKSVFRNEELTDVHEPEFTLLEWYRAFANLERIIEDLEGLLRVLGAPVQKLKHMTVAEVFAQQLGLTLTPNTTRDELMTWARELELSPAPSLDWNDLFHLIWVAKLEESLPKSPFLLRQYPPSQAALARIDADGWGDRFELYWDGLEIANAFHELNDAQEQRERFERDRRKRREYGRTDLPIDEEFMQALEVGLPPSAGIALGVDRLFMALYGYKQIAETRPYSYRQEPSVNK